jgi:multicomponent K+:H+ antiporter subunit C
LRVEDLSINGTRAAGVPLRPGPQELPDGTALGIGDFELRITPRRAPSNDALSGRVDPLAQAPEPPRAAQSQAPAAPVNARTPAETAGPVCGTRGHALMEVLLALVIGVLGGSGVWLVLRPRTFQVIIGLILLSYSVNLFIFSMGSLLIDRPPIIRPGLPANLDSYTDPMPQSLVLTAIVIGFATTSLFLVVLLALRGLSGTDHVDGTTEES